MITIQNAVDSFLSNLQGVQTKSSQRSRPKNTFKNYKSDLLGKSGFIATLDIAPKTPASSLSEEMAVRFLQSLLEAGASAATRQRRAATIREFYRFASAMDLAEVSIEKLNFKIKSGRLLSGTSHHIEFPKDRIEQTLEYVSSLKPARWPNELEIRRNQAFIYTLAESGLRVMEACSIRVVDLDTESRSAVIIGKGDKQAQVYFGSKAWKYLSAYMKLRAESVGVTDWKTLSSHGGQLANWPIFTRHDKNAGKTPKPITPETGEAIIHGFVMDALGEEYDPGITCHSFRHYYVTTVLDKTGDLKTAQDLARHASITTTARYAHRTNKRNQEAHHKIFGEE